MSQAQEFRFIRRQELLAMLGVSRATFERMVAVGLFAKPIQVGKRAVRWRSDEVAECINSMPRIEDAYSSALGGKRGAA